jgi:hypothetical protein
MSKVAKAYAMNSADKALAIDIYEYSVVEFANKNYVGRHKDAFIDLSAIFGQNWLTAKQQGMSLNEVKAANNAYNYANLQLGARGKFIETAKRLLSADEIADDKKLRDIAKEMSGMINLV